MTVLAEGFEYDGKTYASLTPIARTITGAHWSGPRFFGLVQRRPSGREREGASTLLDSVPATPAPLREER
ncbi:hypothetical protein GCM10008171_17140 [Methylopila jiangsuensis]|uniref:DUF2924 domain-containing protein n=1 Tax=Methylopila jiangsuensis TaxID=586230 RepID=A0A9W6JIJ3_9HYPH|nr:hypothetical protein GCM10008171_17140 [Methylopila jiangsuensis]